MEDKLPSQTTPKSAKSSLELKKFLLLLGIPIVIGLIAVVGLYINQPLAIRDTVAQVDISSKGFVPQTLKVKKGQVVSWTNTDTSPHGLEADSSKLESFETVDALNAGDSYSYIFDKDGTFNYYDPANPLVLVGTIVVGDE